MSNALLRKSLNNIFYGDIATSTMDTLATGPFLIAYALMFGAGNIAIGFLGWFAVGISVINWLFFRHLYDWFNCRWSVTSLDESLSTK